MNQLPRSILFTISPPCVVIDCFDENEGGRLHPSGWVVRTLRGSKMKSFQGMMDEFGAALQFFDGFGENWHALGECLNYLDEWLPAEAYLLEVTHPQLLLEEDPEQLFWFLKVMDETHAWWSKPILDNGRYNRPAVPFHVILRATESECAATQQRFPAVPLLEKSEASD